MNDETNLQPAAACPPAAESGVEDSQAPHRDPLPAGRGEGVEPRDQALRAVEDVEPWPQAVDGAALLEELEQVLRRFVVLPKWGAETLALWTVHTYAFELRHVSTYIGIESPERRCGKTTLLSILEKLVNRPAATANISSPAFFRVIGEMRPTLMIDEADTFLKHNDTLRGILNAGYTRETAFVVRMAGRTRVQSLEATTQPVLLPVEAGGGEKIGTPAKGPQGGDAQRGNWPVARFSCWCPKVIAMIGRLPGTLADRCIVIRMQRKLKSEPCERMRKLELGALRRKCLRFVMDHGKEIAKAEPTIPESLNDRAADIWEPLLALADLSDGKWPAAARTAAEVLSAASEGSNPIASLLMDIALIFACMERERILSQELAHELTFAADRPWMEMVKGKAVTERWLAYALRPYGVRPRNMRIEETQGKGYYIDDFKPVFRRYIPDSEVKAQMAELRKEREEESRNAAGTRDGNAAGEKPQEAPMEGGATGKITLKTKKGFGTDAGRFGLPTPLHSDF